MDIKIQLRTKKNEIMNILDSLKIEKDNLTIDIFMENIIKMLELDNNVGLLIYKELESEGIVSGETFALYIEKLITSINGESFNPAR